MVLNVVVVNIDVLRTLIVALRYNKANRWLVVAIELDRIGVLA